MRQRKGFTLIELAIVLVIIGLLIGGILAAQSMIETAKINAQIKQLQQLDITTQNFLGKYNRLPGDINANGVWEAGYPPGVPAPPRMYDGETSVVFEELSTMEGLPGNYSSASTGTVFGPGKKHPYAAIGKGGIYAVMNVRFEPFWSIFAPRTSTASDYCADDGMEAFTPNQALAIDTKIDDGNAFTGNIGIGYKCFPSSCALGQAFCGNAKAANPDDYPFNMGGTSDCVNQSTGAYLPGIGSNSDCGLQIKANITR